MKVGFATNTGHNWEQRPKPGDRELANVEWDDENKCWIKGVRTYFYCTDCSQYAWGAAPMCPSNTKVVMVRKPELIVVHQGAARP